MMPNEGYFSSLKTIGRYFSSLKSFFLPKSVGETPTYFFIFFLFQTYLNSLPRGVEPKPAGCYPGALTTRLETLWLKSLFLSIQKDIKMLLELLLWILNERLVYLIIGQIQMLKNTYAPHPYEHTYVHPISI